MIGNYSFGIFLGLFSTFFYSIMDSSIKFALFKYNIDYVSFYFQSSLLITITLLIIGFLKFKKDLFIVKNPIAIFARGFITFVNFFLVFYILKWLPLDIYYSIIFTAPLTASVFAVFFLKEKFNLLKVTSLFLGFFGILIINNPFSSDFHQEYFIPILITLVISVFVALSGIVTRKYLYDENSIKIAFYVFLICSIFSGLVSIFKTGSASFVIEKQTLSFILQTSLACIIGFFLFLKAYQITPIQLVAPTEYALMIWGVIFGYFVFGNVTTLNTIIGCLIVIVSNIIITIDSKKEKNNA